MRAAPVEGKTPQAARSAIQRGSDAGQIHSSAASLSSQTAVGDWDETVTPPARGADEKAAPSSRGETAKARPDTDSIAPNRPTRSSELPSSQPLAGSSPVSKAHFETRDAAALKTDGTNRQSMLEGSPRASRSSPQGSNQHSDVVSDKPVVMAEQAPQREARAQAIGLPKVERLAVAGQLQGYAEGTAAPIPQRSDARTGDRSGQATASAATEATEAPHNGTENRTLPASKVPDRATSQQPAVREQRPGAPGNTGATTAHASLPDAASGGSSTSAPSADNTIPSRSFAHPEQGHVTGTGSAAATAAPSPGIPSAATPAPQIQTQIQVAAGAPAFSKADQLQSDDAAPVAASSGSSRSTGSSASTDPAVATYGRRQRASANLESPRVQPTLAGDQALAPTEDPVPSGLGLGSDRPLATPGADANAPSSHAPGTHRPATAHSVGQQLAHAAATASERTVELTLSPEELGKVRMTLHATEGSITVAVQADRADTLDLMRRNIDSLARDFRDLGYADISFSFGDQSERRQANPDSPSFTPEPNESEPPARFQTASLALQPQLRDSTQGLDLRI